MNTTISTEKGQIVIPASIRKRFNLKKGTKLFIREEGNQIILQPLTPDYFDTMAGILKTGGKLTKTLLAERAYEKKHEDKK